MLNLDDLTPALAGASTLGDEGRKDFLKVGGGDVAWIGDVGRIVDAGVARIVGAGVDLIDPRIVY